ncbi:E3 ubiquitin/ISG15 ligase TRIM25-like [Dendropsophus ebraccatus]|uniref:E3 ubiquitin/ISG15 ligase TRIM25-like n=1 Tax=Dendropsophus ebraccatus TaxID=150705 RepID=UPI0038310EB2
MASTDVRKELECSICLNLYTDPVTLRCGHNFCRGCIDQVLNTQDGAGVYSCPECREEFQERTGLIGNITLRNVVGNFLSTQLEQDDNMICCTYCVDSPVPAVKSCLMCEASLCDKHLRAHCNAVEHVLTDPSTSLENKRCSIHKKILEYYCTKDAACICVSCCLFGKHNGHKIEFLDEASEKRKHKLREVLVKLIRERKETEERVQSMEERRREAKKKASGEAERVTSLFIDIRIRLEDLEKRVLSEISRQEKKLSLSLSDVIQKLKIKKDELSRKMRHIEELCNMADPLTVLQDPDTGDMCDPEEEHIKDSSDSEEENSDQDISDTLSYIIRGINVTFYVQDPENISLDVNTAANTVRISEDQKTATCMLINQYCLLTFQESQVMSSQRFSSGRHYWDVDISESGWWRVGVCYPSIDRRKRRSYIGDDKKSWCLCGRRQVNNNHCTVIHDRDVIKVSHCISTGRVRVYVDYEAGQLSFYELSVPIKHLYTFTTTFTEPLHAALCIYRGCISLTT